MTYEIGEVEQIITPDGKVFALNNGLTRAITEMGGRGMSGTEYATRQGYKQPFPVVTGWRLEPRTVTLILTFASADRAEYWNERLDIMRHFAFNRGGPFTLRHTRQDGTQRDLLCHTQASPLFENDFAWETDQEEITLIAYDPLFKDPMWKTVSGSFSVSTDPELVFPIEFPIHFEPTLYYQILLTVNYTGTFATYPVLTANGPYSQIVFKNRQTGAQVGLTVPIAVGQKRIIDLNPLRRSIIDENEVSRFNELLLPNSNLTAFNIRQAGAAWENSPFEGVADGKNEIEVTATDPTNNTSVVVTYQRQFVGL